MIVISLSLSHLLYLCAYNTSHCNWISLILDSLILFFEPPHSFEHEQYMWNYKKKSVGNKKSPQDGIKEKKKQLQIIFARFVVVARGKWWKICAAISFLFNFSIHIQDTGAEENASTSGSISDTCGTIQNHTLKSIYQNMWVRALRHRKFEASAFCWKQWQNSSDNDHNAYYLQNVACPLEIGRCQYVVNIMMWNSIRGKIVIDEQSID